VTLDDDVVDRVRQASRSRGESFRETLNNLLRLGLATLQKRAESRVFRVTPSPMGRVPARNYDKIDSLLERGEGESPR
jgi:hypothetical protein